MKRTASWLAMAAAAWTSAQAEPLVDWVRGQLAADPPASAAQLVEAALRPTVLLGHAPTVVQEVPRDPALVAYEQAFAGICARNGFPFPPPAGSLGTMLAVMTQRALSLVESNKMKEAVQVIADSVALDAIRYQVEQVYGQSITSGSTNATVQQLTGGEPMWDLGSSPAAANGWADILGERPCRAMRHAMREARGQ